MATIAENLLNLQNRVSACARSAGRDPKEIVIVAVSKTFNESYIREAASAGQVHFGENYAQEFRRKTIELADLELKWHFIGHLQSNKAKEVVGKTHLLHSLDRISLAKELQKKAEALDVTVDVLIEVHTTDETTKSGVLPDEVLPIAKEMVAFDRIRVQGLMTMGPFTDDPEDSRPCFSRLRQIREELRQDGPASMGFDTLSMGMTADYRVAIEEGATIIRIGTAVFGQRTSHGA